MSKRKKARREIRNTGAKVIENRPRNRNLGLLIGAGAIALTTLAGAFWYNHRTATPTGTKLEETLKQETSSFDISKYGNVVYSYNEGAPNKIYFIGDMHATERDGKYILFENGPRVQLEAYRIAQQLILQKTVQLYLPESIALGENVPRGLPGKLLSELGNSSDDDLEKVLRDFPIDAKLLLEMTYSQLDIKGAENKQSLELQDRTLKAPNEQLYDSMPLIRFVARLRSGYILINAPLVIESEFNRGSITNRNAMITIGNSHMGHFIDFLKNGRIYIPSQNMGEDIIPRLDVPLNLKESNYGVIIIRPLSIK